MNAPRRIVVYLIAIALSATLISCIQTTPKLVKIGLVAPFEGRYREIGVDVIPAARLAIREWAAQHPDSPIAIELVAYDDAGYPDQAVAQARKLSVDPDVAVIIGHWRDDTTAAALPIYEVAALPLITFTSANLESDSAIYNLSPSYDALHEAIAQWNESRAYVSSPQASAIEADTAMQSNPNLVGDETWGLSQFYHLSLEAADQRYFASGFAMAMDMPDSFPNGQSVNAFVRGFEEGSLGSPPGLFSVAAYEATWLALNLVAKQYGIEPAAIDAYEFDSNGRRVDAAIYLYQWVNGERKLIEVFR